MRTIALSRILVSVSLVGAFLSACGGDQGPGDAGTDDAMLMADGDVMADGAPLDADMSDGGPMDGGADSGIEPTCTDECSAGSQVCDGTLGYRVCGQYDLDPCLEPSPPIGCADGYGCVGDTCVPPCRSECPAGSGLCMDEGTLLSCGNFDADACREAGGASACAAGTRCEAGACVDLSAPCVDECAAVGDAVCFGDAVRACGEFDSDSCLDLGPPSACSTGEICGAGVCIAYCTDDCSEA
ncbi:MAG: hypothetical protein OEY14_06245, partial [Myxococcales bacterium]|nr:hypothetical protein [Myxococcales bacterium]